MKTLSVYAKESVFKYPYLFEDFTYVCDDDKILRVCGRDRETGHEWEHAVFNMWDYYLIEKDNE